MKLEGFFGFIKFVNANTRSDRKDEEELMKRILKIPI